MPSTDKSKKEDGRPLICAAFDALLIDTDTSARSVADHLQVNESSVARWRTVTEPDRETVKAIEIFLGVRLGTTERMAGYVVDDEGRSLVEKLEDDPELTPSNRRAIVAAYKAGLEASKQDRKQQAQWRSKRRGQ